MARKTEFYLIPSAAKYRAIRLDIIGETPEHRPYVALHLPGQGYAGTLVAADLERFAVNILKALNSKKLK